MRKGPIACANPHFYGGEIAPIDKPLKFGRNLICRRPTPGRVCRHPLLPPATQQSPDGDPERFSEEVPQREIDPADCGHGDAPASHDRKHVASLDRVVSARPVVHDVPETRDVTGVLPDQYRAEFRFDERAQGLAIGNAAHLRLGFPKTSYTIFGFDPDQSRIERIDGPKV